MVTAVLEPDVAAEPEAKTTDADRARTVRDATLPCQVCGGTHPPGDDSDPQCPVEGF